MVEKYTGPFNLMAYKKQTLETSNDLNVILLRVQSGKCRLYLSLRKALFATDGNNYRKRQPTKMQICRAQSQLTPSARLLHLRLRNHRRTACRKLEKQEVCFEVPSPRNVSKHRHKVSPTLLSEHDLNKDTTNRLATVDLRKFTRPQPYTKNYKQPRNAERVGEAFPRRTHQLVVQY